MSRLSKQSHADRTEVFEHWPSLRKLSENARAMRTLGYGLVVLAALAVIVALVLLAADVTPAIVLLLAAVPLLVLASWLAKRGSDEADALGL
jgi:fatty acid desaturase